MPTFGYNMLCASTQNSTCRYIESVPKVRPCCLPDVNLGMPDSFSELPKRPRAFPGIRFSRTCNFRIGPVPFRTVGS